MNASNTPGITGPDATRSLTYAAFAAAFEYPNTDTLDAIRSGAVADTLRQLLSGIDARLAAEVDWDALRDAGPDADALQVDYTRLFDAGEDGPGCSMNGSAYGGANMETMEELIRYYNFFGLSLPDGEQGEPDRLTTELEFLHYLTYQEFQLRATGEDFTGLLRGQRDFIARHPGAWVPALRGKLAQNGASRFFLELARLLEIFLQHETAHLKREIGPEA